MQEQTANLFLVTSNTTDILKSKTYQNKACYNQQHIQMLIITEAE